MYNRNYGHMWYPVREISGRKLRVLFAIHSLASCHSSSLSYPFAHLWNLFLSAVLGWHRRFFFFLASIGMVIRVLGQGEPLGTRGCVSVRDEGRASSFDVFEFGDRENVCGGKRKERSLKLVSSLEMHLSPSLSLECHFLLRSTEWDSQQLRAEMREKGLRGREIWAFFSHWERSYSKWLNTVSQSS